MEKKEEYKTILITGFGSFRGHQVNASWEAVKILLNLCKHLESCFNVKIVGLEVPVVYKTVSDLVPQLWEQHKPMFVIHVGVSGKSKTLTIESRACGTGYDRPDNYFQLPESHELRNRLFHTEIDIKTLSKAINDNFEESHCKSIVSHNAGRFLCEYIFYKSLSIDCSRVLFIHVPDMQDYPPEQTAQGLYYIIQYLLKCSDS